jgi:hypothetical protein
MTEFIEIPLTQEQEDERKVLEKEWLAKQEAFQAREQAKLSAIDKLAKLGLTEEEAKAIVGL